jgi:hypothetical protein
MIATQIASIITEYVVFLELADEDELNPDTTVKMMEALGGHLEESDRRFLRELVDAFPIMAEGYSGEAREVVRNIAHGFHLAEAFASDDPARLVEMKALRDARD